MHLALGDFTQGHHRGLVVLPFDERVGAVRQPARALGREQHELEHVLDVVQTVFDGNAGHGNLAEIQRTGPSRLPFSGRLSE